MIVFLKVVVCLLLITLQRWALKQIGKITIVSNKWIIVSLRSKLPPLRGQIRKNLLTINDLHPTNDL